MDSLDLKYLPFIALMFGTCEQIHSYSTYCIFAFPNVSTNYNFSKYIQFKFQNVNVEDLEFHTYIQEILTHILQEDSKFPHELFEGGIFGQGQLPVQKILIDFLDRRLPLPEYSSPQKFVGELNILPLGLIAR